MSDPITHYDISTTVAAKDGSAVCLNVAEALTDTLRAFAEQHGLNIRTCCLGLTTERAERFGVLFKGDALTD